MTINRLMHTGNVTADVHIDVFDLDGICLIYSGPYDQSLEAVYSLSVDSFEVTHTRERDGRLYIDRMTITTE